MLYFLFYCNNILRVFLDNLEISLKINLNIFHYISVLVTQSKGEAHKIYMEDMKYINSVG